MEKVLVTGASGFVGRALVNELVEKDHSVVAVSRKKLSLTKRIEQVQIRDVSEWQNWSDLLTGVDVIVHAAARVHLMDDDSNALAEYRRVNRDATIQLAKQAAQAGVRRFIFLSSIKVNGESTLPDKSFSESDACMPIDPYGQSKWEAELGLMHMSQETGMEVVIIRPPLIYGPGVKGNFANMMHWVSQGIPLPFARVKNQRSLLALDNLVSFIISCLDHPNAANETFLLSDGEDLALPEIIQKIAHCEGRKARLIPVPVCWMKLVARMLGKSDIANRLFGSLQVNSRKAQELLNWAPVVSIDEQLKKMVTED